MNACKIIPCYQVEDKPEFVVISGSITEAINVTPQIGSYFGETDLRLVTNKTISFDGPNMLRVVIGFDPPMIGEGI